MGLFNEKDFKTEVILERMLQELCKINSNLETIQKVMSTNPPVTQATFDAALSQVNAALTGLLSVGQNIGQGLQNLEAALLAAQQNPGSTDLSGELAIVNNMQAELVEATTNANTLLSSIPTAEQPASQTSSQTAQGTQATGSVSGVQTDPKPAA